MRPSILFVLILLSVNTLFAQSNTHFTSSYSAEVGAFVSSSKRMPFWLRANQYGIVPLTAPVGTLRLGTQGEWRPDSSAQHNRWFVKYGAYAVGNVAQKSQVLLPEAYAMAGIGKFYAYAGRRREIIGLGDSTLSSGFYSWSQNAMPITKVQIGTNGFVPLGFTKGIISVNFLYAHGWFPNTDSVQGSFLHQKTLFGRIGKPNWKVRLYGGVVHNVQWGGRSNYVRREWTMNGSGKFASSFQDYLRLVVAKTPGGEGYSSVDSLNQIGNHLGSLDFGIDVDLKGWNVLVYHQHPFEDKSGLVFLNFPDGLYGLRSKNTKMTPIRTFRVRQVTFEYLTTMNRLNSVPGKYEGDEYFNHGQYIDGWARGQRVIGTPFISRWNDTRQDLYGSRQDRMISNNTIKVYHAALMGEFSSGISLDMRLSVSENFGYFRGGKRDQFSGVIRTGIPIAFLGGSEVQAAVSLDKGGLFHDALGGYIGLRKVW
ncbi:capsule assembly Wzi family protein [Tellurirhabdus bombi]|uniref:capsule assembly Wzi family protein n=1 Tax=Tellurirhabdus bombi TaxID=2907205 RepID=UPI001F381006|nr:capsule assembly Wzi family protein [Tellurirhabdus bombi]